MATVGTPVGRTEARYSSVWSRNSSQLGSETTRAAVPRAARRPCASTAKWTSEPLAISTTSGTSACSGAITYAPRATPALAAPSALARWGTF